MQKTDYTHFFSEGSPLIVQEHAIFMSANWIRMSCSGNQHKTHEDQSLLLSDLTAPNQENVSLHEALPNSQTQAGVLKKSC